MPIGPETGFEQPWLDETRQRLDALGQAWVVGVAGSGRSTLAARLASDLPGGHLVSLPSFGADAATHALVQLAAWSSSKELRELAANDEIPPAERARLLGEACRHQGRTVVVRVPRSWALDERPASDRDEADSEQFAGRAREVLASLVETLHTGLVVVTDRSYRATTIPWNQKANPHIRLEPYEVPVRDLGEDLGAWGPYAEHARRLAEAVAPDLRASWLNLRLAVGLVALGEPVEAVLPLLERNRPIRQLSQRAVELLNKHRNASLLAGVVRVAQSRYALPRPEAVKLARLPEEHEPLVLECLAYGADDVRMPEEVRLQLQAPVPSELEDYAQSHAELARRYAALDGVPRAAEAVGPAACAWLERVHHLANAGPAVEDQWSELDLTQRDLLWDRARSLSRVHKKYAEAAALYRRCIALHPDDAYAWQYLGYNLERARPRPASREVSIDEAYREAVRLDPQNPWWNRRFVTYLISAGRFREAETTWDQAIRNVDPAQRGDPGWLALHFYRRVAEAWLDHGFPHRARAVFERVEPDVRAAEARLLQLGQRIADAVEVDELGGSVYPAAYPTELRWKQPTLLPERLGSADLESWFAARVVDATAEAVEIVLATPEKRLFAKRVPAPAWETGAGEPALDAQGYYFVGSYSDESLVIRPMETDTGADEHEQPAGYWSH